MCQLYIRACRVLIATGPRTRTTLPALGGRDPTLAHSIFPPLVDKIDIGDTRAGEIFALGND